MYMSDVIEPAQLMQLLDTSPTPFHVTANMAARLRQAGFQQLAEADSWQLQSGVGYFVTRNDSSLVAFTLGTAAPVDVGWRILGAHTDSPCLKLKPQPVRRKHGYVQLGVEVYGGVLLNPWFDRDLSLAGRVSFRDHSGDICSTLIDLRRPIGMVPSLAIHLDREANSNRSINAQLHLPVLMGVQKGDDSEQLRDIRAWLAELLAAQTGGETVAEVLDFELSFYDTQPAASVGLLQEFLASARLDNLLSCAIGLEALLAADGEQPCLLVCTDHEEVGSVSHAGAQGPFLKTVLQRIHGSNEELARAMDRSLLVSADNAHALHPNFADKYDDNHGPAIGGGPVIKTNANQRYASNSETSALFRQLCADSQVPVQSFVVRADMGCGSTIGPLTAAGLGVRTIDVGVPQLAMHSIRETAGWADIQATGKVALQFFNRPRIWAQA
jgi:aspartyl aminopeptidase